MYKIKELVEKLQKDDYEILGKLQIYNILDNNGIELTDETIDNILSFYIDSRYCENIDDLETLIYHYCQKFNLEDINNINFEQLRDYEENVITTGVI